MSGYARYTNRIDAVLVDCYKGGDCHQIFIRFFDLVCICHIQTESGFFGRGKCVILPRKPFYRPTKNSRAPVWTETGFTHAFLLLQRYPDAGRSVHRAGTEWHVKHSSFPRYPQQSLVGQSQLTAQCPKVGDMCAVNTTRHRLI